MYWGLVRPYSQPHSLETAIIGKFACAFWGKGKEGELIYISSVVAGAIGRRILFFNETKKGTNAT